MIQVFSSKDGAPEFFARVPTNLFPGGGGDRTELSTHFYVSSLVPVFSIKDCERSGKTNQRRNPNGLILRSITALEFPGHSGKLVTCFILIGGLFGIQIVMY